MTMLFSTSFIFRFSSDAKNRGDSFDARIVITFDICLDSVNAALHLGIFCDGGFISVVFDFDHFVSPFFLCVVNLLMK